MGEDLVDILAKFHANQRQEEDSLKDYARERYGQVHPEISSWDYDFLCDGLIQNVLPEFCAEEFIDWVMLRMTPEMLAELRHDSDRFQDHYADLYLAEQEAH